MKPLVTAAAAALVAGCAPLAPLPIAGHSPADPSAPTPLLRAQSVTAGTADYRPVEPKPWAERNRAVTDKPMEGM